MSKNTYKDLQVGSRIQCDGFFGTVKYVGTITDKPSTWIGIDWDDPTRGRHDGTINNLRYFTTRHSTSGSFIQPEKLKFVPQSLTDALIKRYGEEEDVETQENNAKGQKTFQDVTNAKFVMMVGFDKVFEQQSNLLSLRIADLSQQNINRIGNLNELCPNLVELDVSANLLNSWQDVLNICEQMKHLQLLNISKNSLQLPANLPNKAFPNIRTLICGKMYLSWLNVVWLFKMFPKVQEFRCPFNCIHEIREMPSIPSLKLLDIEGNSIGSWSDICNLSNASNLETLIIDNIDLASIKFNPSDSDDVTPVFKNLHKLSMSNNLINDWQSVSELNRLQNLENLKLSKNPITEEKDSLTIMYMVIARIEKLKTINNITIEPGERRGAEYDYLKQNSEEWFNVKDSKNEEQFLRSHTRFQELIQKYGEPQKVKPFDNFKTIKGNSITLKMIYNGTSISKQVPSSITVQKLKQLTQKYFKLTNRPKLLCRDKVSNIEIVLDNDLKEISLYSVKDGDEIYIETM